MNNSENASFDHYDYEQLDEYEGEASFAFLNNFCPEESYRSFKVFTPKWRRAPRSPSDFSDSKTTISSCRDSDYERWLENYYNDLININHPKFDQQVDTSDLVTEKPQQFAQSIFTSIKKGPWMKSTKYWGPNEVRRHWPLRKKQGKYLLFPTIHPDLNLRSRYGRFHSLLYTAAAIPEGTYQALVQKSVRKAVEFLVHENTKVTKILNCDNLYSMRYFDPPTKMALIRSLCKFFKSQHNLEKVYFENAYLKRLEAIILLCALSKNGGDQIKELHIWKMFDYGQCPVLMSELPEEAKKLRENSSMEFLIQIHYQQILRKFSCLTHLSINYAYLANWKGDALLSIKSIQIGCMRELRILCLKEERPFLTNPSYGVGGWLITDGAWRRAVEWCPEMRVKFVFLNMAQYENIILFLSKNIPVSSIYISSGIDFTFSNPWDIDSTLLELRNWYSTTLESLSLHLWHHRDLLDYVIKQKILQEFPNLLNFEFIGVLEDVETLNAFCCRLSRGIYKLKTLLFWVEEQHTDKKKLEVTRKRVKEIREKYEKRFVVINVDADIQTYPLFSDFRWKKMEKKRFKVSVNCVPPFVDFFVDDGDIVLEGVLGELWTTLEERLGFSSEYLKGNRSVAFSNFRNKKSDAILCPAARLTDPSSHFVMPVTELWFEIYLKNNDVTHYSHSLTENWSSNLWISTIFLVFVLIATLYVTLQVSNKYFEDDDFIISESLIQHPPSEKKFHFPANWRKTNFFYRQRQRENEISLNCCFTAVMAAMSSQDICMQTKITSARILLFSLLIYGKFMYDAYSGLLISQLTLGTKCLPFYSLNEIPETVPKYSLCIRPDSSAHLLLMGNKSGENVRTKWNIVNRKPCPVDLKPNSTDICASRVAFLEIPIVMKDYMKNIKCKMIKLPKKYFHNHVSLIVAKHVGKDAQARMEIEMLKYRERGIISRLKKVWLTQEKTAKADDEQVRQISYEHIHGVLIAYLVCLAFSCFILFLEFLLFYFDKFHTLFIKMTK